MIIKVRDIKYQLNIKIEKSFVDCLHSFLSFRWGTAYIEPKQTLNKVKAFNIYSYFSYIL